MITREIIVRVIETLKGIDVRGFDSMDKLVGLVMLFQNVLNDLDMQAQQMQHSQAQQAPIPQTMKDGDGDGTE